MASRTWPAISATSATRTSSEAASRAVWTSRQPLESSEKPEKRRRGGGAKGNRGVGALGFGGGGACLFVLFSFFFGGGRGVCLCVGWFLSSLFLVSCLLLGGPGCCCLLGPGG